MREVSVLSGSANISRRPQLLPDPDTPRLGHFPDPLFNRLEFLLARLLDPAPFGPELAPFGTPLFRVRTFEVRVAVGPREGFPRRNSFSSVCSADLAGCSVGCPGCTLLTGFSPTGTLLGEGTALPASPAAIVCAFGCSCSCVGAEAGLVATARGAGCAGAAATDIGSADILSSSLDTLKAGWKRSRPDSRRRDRRRQPRSRFPRLQNKPSISACFGSIIHAENAWHGPTFRHGLVRKLNRRDFGNTERARREAFRP